jgi:ATP-binding cassette subfamily B protein
MTFGNASTATSRVTSAETKLGVSDLQTLREALQLLWAVADAFAKRRLLIALFLVATGALLAALTPIALKLLIDSLTAGPLASPTASPIAAPSAFVFFAPIVSTPIVLVLLYVCGQYLTRLLTELRTLAHGQAEQRVRRHIGRELFEHLVRLPLRFHLERRTGAIGETAEQGIRGYQLLLTHLIYTILPVTVEFVAVGAVLVHFGHASYLAIFAVASVVYVTVFRRGAVSILEPARTISASHIEAHAVLNDSLLNFETVKYFDAGRIVCSRYDAALGRTESAWRSFYHRRMTNGAAVATIFALSLGTTLVLATRDVLAGAMTAGDFVMLNAYVLRLVQPLEMLGFAVRDIAQGLAFLQRMLELFRETPEIDVRHAAIPVQDSRGALVFINVGFSYRPDRTILRGVSFTVPPGRSVAVVGASGSGKSSLIRLLFRLYEPDAGRILLDGVSISQMSLSMLRQAIAVVPQDTVLFHDSIASNIGFGRDGASMEEIQEAARIANLHDFILAMPDGYDTIVGERGLKLSGGERQRIAIARAVLKRPRVFVFDEATSSLDSRTEREILTNLISVSHQCTTLVIAHRLSTIANADEILVLDDGRIAERGTHQELRDLHGLYAALWQAQHSGPIGNDGRPVRRAEA